MRFQVLLLLVIAALISSCSSAVEPSPTSEAQPTQEPSNFATESSEEGEKGTFRLGQDGERSSLSTFSFIDTKRDRFTVVIINTYDPLPDAKDDEIHFGVVIQSNDPSSIPTREVIDIPSDKYEISVVVGAFCFCSSIPLAEGSGQHFPVGKVYFESFTQEEVQGNAYLRIDGDIPSFAADEPFFKDLWRVNTLLELEIPYFVAVPRE